MQVLKHILDYWTAGGILLVPLAAVSFSIWFYFLRTRSALLAAAEIPSGFEHRILETADEDRLIPGAVKYAAGAARAGPEVLARDAVQPQPGHREGRAVIAPVGRQQVVKRDLPRGVERRAIDRRRVSTPIVGMLQFVVGRSGD